MCWDKSLLIIYGVVNSYQTRINVYYRRGQMRKDSLNLYSIKLKPMKWFQNQKL